MLYFAWNLLFLKQTRNCLFRNWWWPESRLRNGCKQTVTITPSVFVNSVLEEDRLFPAMFYTLEWIGRWLLRQRGRVKTSAAMQKAVRGSNRVLKIPFDPTQMPLDLLCGSLQKGTVGETCTDWLLRMSVQMDWARCSVKPHTQACNRTGRWKRKYSLLLVCSVLHIKQKIKTANLIMTYTLVQIDTANVLVALH